MEEGKGSEDKMLEKQMKDGKAKVYVSTDEKREEGEQVSRYMDGERIKKRGKMESLLMKKKVRNKETKDIER